MNALPTLTPHMILLYTYILHRWESIKKLLEWQADTLFLAHIRKQRINSPGLQAKCTLAGPKSATGPSKNNAGLKQHLAGIGPLWYDVCGPKRNRKSIGLAFLQKMNPLKFLLHVQKPPCDGGVNPRDLKMVQCEWERKNSLIWSLRGRGATEEEGRRADLGSSHSELRAIQHVFTRPMWKFAQSFFCHLFHVHLLSSHFSKS